MSYILVTGGSGQVAYELAHHADMAPLPVRVYPRNILDITDANAIKKILAQDNCALVINAAAYTAVDKAENEQDLAFQVNVEGSRYLAEACAAHCIPFIHLSTDYIFDGTKKTPYLETDHPKPLNVYGESKWQGEQAVRSACDQHIILRVSSIFSAHGNNFVKTILRLARERDELNIVSDQWMCPTPAADIARAIFCMAQTLSLEKNDLWGTYHYASSPATTWYEFAKQIVAEAEKYHPVIVKKIHPISAAEYKTPAHRPLYSVLNTEKFCRTFDVSPTLWLEGLQHVIESLSTS